MTNEQQVGLTTEVERLRQETKMYALMIADRDSNVERLQQENDRLRGELLKAPDAQMIAFIAAFEVVLNRNATWSNGPTIVFVASRWGELKSEHLDDMKGT